MLKVKRVERVAIAVKSIEAAMPIFEKLGAEFQPEEWIEEIQMRYRPFKIGSSMMELLESAQDNSLIDRFLESRGEGVHHVTLEVENLDDAIADLESKGVAIAHRIDYPPETTFEGCHWREAFIHPKDACGVLIHLAEKTKKTEPQRHRDTEKTGE